MYAIPRLLTILFLALAFLGCKKDPQAPQIPVDLAQARLNDFKLAEVTYTTIDISHPALHNGAQTERGRIQVTIPKGATGLRLTPEPSNFTNDRFTISPRMGEARNFSSGVITYTITSKDDASKQVHYDVTITEEEPPAPVAPKVTALKFEAAKNAGLSNDVVATRIDEGVATLGRIYIFVPVGTDFSQLTPTITHEGGTLYYSQDASASPGSATTTFPASGMAIDFAWPKVFYAIVKGATSVNTYEVFVDVRNPIKLEQGTVTTASLSKGSSHFIQVSSLVNQGNRPITLAGVDHTGQVPSGINAVRCSSSFPSLGLNPGARAVVNATISGQTYPPGTYQTTAVFRPGFYGLPEAHTLLQPSTLQVTTTIID